MFTMKKDIFILLLIIFEFLIAGYLAFFFTEAEGFVHYKSLSNLIIYQSQQIAI